MTRKEYTYKLPLVSLSVYAFIIGMSNDISMWWGLGPLLFWFVAFVLVRLLIGIARAR